MASILKTDEIQSQNGGAVVKMQTLKHPSASGNNITLASDGSATIANGTINAGTLGSSIIHSIGWQHIEDKHHTSSSSAVNYFEFQNVFSDDYIMFCIHVGQINFNSSSSDFHFRLMNSSGAISTASYFGASHMKIKDFF